MAILTRAWACFAVLGIGLAIVSAEPSRAQQQCLRAEFEAVVDEAGDALRRSNGSKKPLFQSKLRQLREKKGWSDLEFRERALPFVQDPEITKYDDRIRERLFEITQLGSDDDGSASADCTLLQDLKGTLEDLVATLEEKWTYMFAKIDRALTE